MSDLYISNLTHSLSDLLKHRRLPMEAIGDLADLLGTMEELVRLLKEVASAHSPSSEDIPSKLYELQIALEQDLPMIISDLLPALQNLSGEVIGGPGAS